MFDGTQDHVHIFLQVAIYIKNPYYLTAKNPSSQISYIIQNIDVNKENEIFPFIDHIIFSCQYNPCY